MSTTPCARSIQGNLGSPAYSYYFVLNALAPVLERFGVWRLVEQPESRLAFLARQARAEGYRPVHLALNPLQDAYVSPALPTILFPFWEFPDLPDRDFGHDTRQNWLRIARQADLIVTACRFTADAFRRAGVSRPVAVVPVPVPLDAFELPDWDPKHVLTLNCRHEVWGDTPVKNQDGIVSQLEGGEEPLTLKRKTWRLARLGFRRIHPWLRPETVGRITRWKHRFLALSGKSPAKLVYLELRGGYRRLVRPWLSDLALARITRVKNRALALAGHSPTLVIDPLLPTAPLILTGLVYTTIFNLGDERKNYRDALTAFLTAFRDRADATLVMKLATSPHREHHEVGILRSVYRSLGLTHRCRVVVVTDYLSDDQMTALMQSTTFYVNTSHAEGACLPLQRALAGGRPAIAPDHTAMADYMDDAVGFVPRSHPEPTCWPHDPERRLETIRYRLVWSDLVACFRSSALAADSDRSRYEEMAAAARRRMSDHGGRSVAVKALANALEQLPEPDAENLARAS
ncbi:MAG: glycosyltransferase [Isosphaeraceae bacterium]